jgi:hypothetical protein
VVENIAKRTFTELAVSLALAGFCCCFVASAGITTLLTGVAVQTIVNLVLRSYVGYHDYKSQSDPVNHVMPTFAKWLGATSFAWGSAINVQTIVHEAGHAIAIKAFLANAHPKIILLAYRAGVTLWKGVKEVTTLGKLIGRENIQPIIAGAGPALTLALSTVMLGAGLATTDSSPEISRMLIVAALTDFCTHVVYALTAITTNTGNLSHDFVALWQLAGIHPITAAIAIGAIPIVMIAGYAIYRFRKCGPEAVD